MMGGTSIPPVNEDKKAGSKSGPKKKGSANPKILSNSNKKASIGGVSDGPTYLVKANSMVGA